LDDQTGTLSPEDRKNGEEQPVNGKGQFVTTECHGEKPYRQNAGRVKTITRQTCLPMGSACYFRAAAARVTSGAAGRWVAVVQFRE
jgi:hypothetical protein